MSTPQTTRSVPQEAHETLLTGWLEAKQDRFGKWHAVAALEPTVWGEHDPLADLADKLRPDQKIIAVVVAPEAVQS